MKHKKAFTVVLGVIALFLCSALLYQSQRKYDGSTVERRALLLDKAIALSSGKQWKIATETKIDDCIISGAYRTDGKASLAIFKPLGNGRYHQFMTSRNRDLDSIIVDSFTVNGTSYDLVWFNGAQTEYAEITYTINGQQTKPMRYNTENMNIICIENNATDYTIQAVFYDKDGNRYGD